jgi:hypothetical protein
MVLTGPDILRVVSRCLTAIASLRMDLSGPIIFFFRRTL